MLERFQARRGTSSRRSECQTLALYFIMSMRLDNPYAPLMERWRTFSDTGGGIRIAKVLLSLYNGQEHPYSIAELNGLSPEYAQLLMDCVVHYLKRGEDEALREAGREILDTHPWLMDFSNDFSEWRYNREKEFERVRQQRIRDEERNAGPDLER